VLESLDRNGWLPAEMRATWSDIMRSIRSTDPYHNPLTIHPIQHGTDQVDDPSTMDIDWLQTGHGGQSSAINTINMLEDALGRQPKMPVIVSEVNYEGILESSREEIQRFLFWSCLLSGAAGHTYGANGIWQANTKEQPHGASPHGIAWGNRPWQEAYKLPGSGQVGIGKKTLEQFDWSHFETHPEWVTPHQTAANRIESYAAGIPGKVRVLYLPVNAIKIPPTKGATVSQLEPGVTYKATWVDPKTGDRTEIGAVTGDAAGEYALPTPAVLQDWVVILEAK
jgi:hypothetical protein